MEALELTEKQQMILVCEILRFLDQADLHAARAADRPTDWDRGAEDGKALAFQAAAMRLGEMTGLVTQGMTEDVVDQVVKLRERATAAVV